MLTSITASEEDSKVTPDWSREHKAFFEWAPSRSLLISIRSYQKYNGSSNIFYIVLKKLTILRHHFWSMVTGADIPINTLIGGGLLIPHPNGIVIHPAAKIGVNCLIFQQVTLGTREDSSPPEIGNCVDIGAGAKILGEIRVGNFAKIGANAVVITDVPEGKIAVGVPARIIE